MASIIDIDSALKNILKKIYINKNVAITFKDSWGELIKETFPEITIMQYNFRIDLDRFTGDFYHELRAVEVTPITYEIDIKKTPLPVDLFYQLDIYTRKMREDREFTELMYGAFGIHYNFIVNETTNFLMDFMDYAQLDFMLKGRPVYRKAFRYLIRARLDVVPDFVKTVPAIQEVAVAIKNK